MFEIIKRLFDICLFRKGPQDLPRQAFLLYLLVFFNVLVSFLILHMGNTGFKSALQAATGPILEMCFCAFTLFCFGKLPRYQQTLSALLGTDALISFFALPVMATMMVGQGGLGAFLLMAGLIIWHWAVIGHILRHALGQHLSFSLGVALLYLLASYKVMALLFPEAPNVN
ncbi:MAG: hypothetical protein CTY16_13965 [Methylobacter sp.]|uniref:hypothetical protein n=1 Tax=Methylovulum miyakonense TaxID=645578 RepID=UPI0003636BCE|nr:hypothetical protein [Methylovulum miyakonense]PPD43149.1 MAG: hypothetical protein CTY16_13965 [Methylobacter sp.]